MNPIEEIVHLESDEHISALYRKHGATVFLTILPFGLLTILLFLFIFPLFSLGVRGMGVFAFLGVLFILLAFRKIVAWLGTITILTNKRLLVIHRNGFFKKKVNEIKLDQISELSYEVRGMMQTIGHYGTLFLLVTFTSTTIHIPDIPNPETALNAISKAIADVPKSPLTVQPQRSSAAGGNEKEKRSKREDEVDAPSPDFHSVPRRDPVNWK